jgi:cobalt-zinc-cadmium efflux system membrane fusion protein
LVAGCSQETGDTSPVASSEEHEHEHEHGEEGHNLHGYWCVEHGVPEEICAQCDTKLAVEFQDKGDWCEEHNRPDSQCFIHHPELEEKFIAQYEAKFGEKPPARE